jgi:HEAT repeat protein
MLLALWIAVVVIFLTFFVMTLIIIGNKIWRAVSGRFRAARRRELEPILLNFLHGNERSILPALDGSLQRRDRVTFEEILLDHADRVRGIERERICRIAEELGFVDEYLEQLKSHRWWIRARAAERLGLSGAARSTKELAQHLEDDSPEVRMRAAAALGRLGGVTSIRSLIGILDQRNRWSSIRIGDILAQMGQTVQKELVDRFPTLSPSGKVAALDIIARLRPLDQEEWLIDRLRDEHADIRARACHALGMLGDRHAAPALEKALQDEKWPVRAMAAKALGRMHAESSIPPLRLTMRDREWWPRSNAAEALREMGQIGTSALKEMLDDEDNYARHQAVLMLEADGLIDRTVDDLDAPEDRVRLEAEALLIKVVYAGQTDRLHELARLHRRQGVRETLELLLGGPNVTGGVG